MKIKILAVLGLATFLSFGGCRSASNNGNVAVLNTNTNTTTMMTPMATPMATIAPAKDMATQATVQSALTKAGITGVTVDATTTEVTLRGSVAKGKLGEAFRIATEKGGGKRVNNQLVEAK